MLSVDIYLNNNYTVGLKIICTEVVFTLWKVSLMTSTLCTLGNGD